MAIDPHLQGAAARLRAIAQTRGAQADRPKPSMPTLSMTDAVRAVAAEPEVRDDVSIGISLLHEFLSTRPRHSEMLLSDQIRAAVAAGDKLALRIVRSGILGELAQWMDRKP